MVGSPAGHEVVVDCSEVAARMKQSQRQVDYAAQVEGLAFTRALMNTILNTLYSQELDCDGTSGPATEEQTCCRVGSHGFHEPANHPLVTGCTTTSSFACFTVFAHPPQLQDFTIKMENVAAHVA